MAETNPTIQCTELFPCTELQVNNAIPSDATDYINERIHEYEDENLYGSELHASLMADFHKFTIKTFKKDDRTIQESKGFSSKQNLF